MKVTAILPHELVDEVKRYAKGETLTDSLKIALKEWLAAKRIVSLNRTIKKNPLTFNNDFVAGKIRSLNRK